jgi:hypothetical protein
MPSSPPPATAAAALTMVLAMLRRQELLPLPTSLEAADRGRWNQTIKLPLEDTWLSII